MRTSRGFTLLEVLVALAIVALVLGSALFVLGNRLEQQYRLEQQDRARWVAINVLERLRLEQPWPAAGQQSGEADMGEQHFYWLLDAVDTEQAGVRRVDVRVYADRERQWALARLTTLATRP